jgi:hypothetical protein
MTKKLRTRKALTVSLAALAMLLTAGLYAVAQQTMTEATRDRGAAVTGGTYYMLPATLETTQWGWLPRSRRSSSSSQGTRWPSRP